MDAEGVKIWKRKDLLSAAVGFTVNGIVGLLQLAAILAAAVWLLATFPDLNPDWTATAALPLAIAVGATSMLIAAVLNWWQKARRRRKAAAAKALLAAPPLSLAAVVEMSNRSRAAIGKQPLVVPAGLEKIWIPYSRVGVTLATLCDVADGVQVCFVSIAPGSTGQSVPLPELVEKF